MKMRRYTKEDVANNRFFQLPKFLFEGTFKALSSDAKILYAPLRDRHDLSECNGWVNGNNEVFLIYTRENMAEMLGCSVPTARKAFKQLERLGLVEDEFQGLNKPNLIYLSVVSVDNTRTEKTFQSGMKECFGQDRKDFSPNDTLYNNTDYSNTDKYKVYNGDAIAPRDMEFSFDILNNQIDKVFKDKYDNEYIGNLTKEDIKELFAMFYKIGNYRRGIVPTKLKNEQVENIIDSIYCIGDNEFEPSIEDYRLIIEDYFKQDFDNCDYGINHFISGDILVMRCYNLEFLP